MTIVTEPGDLIDVLVCGGGMAGSVRGRHRSRGRRPTAGHREGRRTRRVDADVRRHDLDGAEHGRHGDLGPRRRPRSAAAAGRGLEPGLAWLDVARRRGRPRRSTTDRQVGAEVDVHELTDRLVAAIEAEGGRVLTETALEAIDGRRRRHRRTSTVAEGGGAGARSGHARSSSPPVGSVAAGAARAVHRARTSASMLLRANPRSTGDGLLAALGAGARTSPSMWTFYGHTMPGLPADPPPAGGCR